MTADTIYKKIEQTAKFYPKNIALGYKVNGHYKTMTYGRLMEKVNRCVSGLRKLGVNSGDKIAIFSKNCPYWVILDLALNKMGAISVAIHTTLSPKYIKYILEDSEARFLAIGDLFSKYLEISSQVSLEKVIVFNRIEWKEGLVYFEDLLKEAPDQELPIKSEFSSIIYTSGTTGNPKGVMLSNLNFLENIKAALTYIPVTTKDIFLSFLPFSHVLERTGGYYTPLSCGSAIFFAEDRRNVAEDIKKVKPTIMVSIPRMFEKVYEKVMDTLAKKSPFEQKLFYASLKICRKYLNAKKENSPMKFFFLISHYFFDKFILGKVRHNLGGRLKFSISGGACLNESIARFFETLGIKVLEGYGLTETSPIISVNPINNYKFGSVGQIVPGVQVKIADDDEILVKGPNVMLGYYNNEKATQESFTNDGWLKTGDLGHLDNEGFLTIVGRKKEMIVTSTGKNVNPVNLENALQESAYINQCLVYGDKQKYLSALIVPDFEKIKSFAKDNNIGLEVFELIHCQPIIDLIRNEINNRLKDFPENEQIADFKILDKEFSEEREELTPTLKLKRDKILGKYLP